MTFWLYPPTLDWRPGQQRMTRAMAECISVYLSSHPVYSHTPGRYGYPPISSLF